MFNPDVLDYFLVLLGGFGVVWSYRKTRGQQDRRIGEVEYAAFSTLWGIPVFFIYYWAIKYKSELVSAMFTLPMLTTPFLFLIGAALGYVGAQLMSCVELVRSRK